MQFAEEILAYQEAHREEYLRDLAELVRIPSVSEEMYQASEEAPFGTYCVEALDAMLALCRRYGFETRKIGNVIGIVDYGPGERELDIVSHLDVQPAGPGWITDPFTLTIDGDYAYGRGASDDKGPALAAVYALRAVKDLKLPLSKAVRLVFGTGEEYGISDIHYYTDSETMPPFMFTPDHSYPIVNGNKAGYSCTMSCAFSQPAAGGYVREITGGDNRGAVPGTCTASLAGIDGQQIRAAAAAAAERTGIGFDVEERGAEVVLTAHGVSTHAIKADKGNNSVTAMLELVCSLPLAEGGGHALLRRFSKAFPHGDVQGRTAGLYREEDPADGSLFNFGIFRYTQERLYIQQRATLPCSIDLTAFSAAFRETLAGIGLCVSEESFAPGRKISLEDPYVSRLLRSYEFYTGQKAFGFTEGGGDYSRSFPHGVSFGCEPYGMDTHMHGAQEFVSIDIMMKSICIFAQSILEICR